MIASREAQLATYAALVRKWNPAINLVAPSTLPLLETRHIADSLQLSALVPDDAPHWLDIGSGGGLPGIILAIDCPGLPVRLIDSDKRKVAFLNTAIRELMLTNCSATAARIETAPPSKTLHVSARALAPLPRLVPYVHRHLAENGTAWLMKGRNWQSEVDAVSNHWAFSLKVHSSMTEAGAAILELRDLRALR